MRLAIVCSHPIQYNAPWFRYLTEMAIPGLRVFYLWNGGVTGQFDRGFNMDVRWDIPLLDGYDYEFVENRASQPGTSSRLGLDNPQLAARVAAFRPDAVLLFGYNYLSCYRFLLSRTRPRVPLLFRGDSHRLVTQSGVKARLRRRWITAVFRRFSAFLFVGQANRAYFKYHDVPDSRLFFSPHAVDNARYAVQQELATGQAAALRAQYGINPSSQVIMFAGKFERKKRARDLVAAFRSAGVPGATLVLVGSGEDEADLRKAAAGASDIVFLPFQNQTEMPRIYMLADLFVLPSHGPDESWGLAVNEAMCMGRPVVVSDHVGCARDLVRPGRNGLVFAAGNVPSLAAALREAFSNVERLDQWGGQSREIISTYSYVQATNGLVSALASVCASNSQLLPE